MVVGAGALGYRASGDVEGGDGGDGGLTQKIARGDAKNGKDRETNALSIEIYEVAVRFWEAILPCKWILRYMYITYTYHIPNVPRQCFMQTTGVCAFRSKVFFESKPFHLKHPARFLKPSTTPNET